VPRLSPTISPVDSEEVTAMQMLLLLMESMILFDLKRFQRITVFQVVGMIPDCFFRGELLESIDSEQSLSPPVWH
jgi:hypothetical protein